MNINWKVRLKNPTFWAQIIIAVHQPDLSRPGCAVAGYDDLGGAVGCPA